LPAGNGHVRAGGLLRSEQVLGPGDVKCAIEPEVELVEVGTLTVVPGRATPLQGGVHLSVFAAYLVLAVNP
jgi:hypothetical protein